jgi:hypothetical protein
MAKSSRSKTSVRKTPSTPLAIAGDQVTSLLTAAERKLLDGTVGRTLVEASQKQLHSTMVKARRLRDKWRDLFNRQMKSSKRTARRGEPTNSRSLDKSELFAAAVRRIEGRLGEFVDGVTTAVTGRKPAARAAKSVRTAGHRASRASVRKSLASLVEATKQPAGRNKPAAAPVPAERSADATAGSGNGAKRSGAPVTRPVASKKARQAGKRKAVAATGGAVNYDPKKQRSAKASATVARIKFDGLSTRRRGHTLMAGKRKQARRDGR